jgi:sugar/nucleoside kinase (ribokinase family)
VRPAVAVIGNLAVDVVDGGSPRIGGGAYHCARALRLLGVQALIVTKLGADQPPRLLHDLLALGLPVVSHQAGSTARFAHEYDGAQRTTALVELGEPWTPDDVRGWMARALAGVRWVHAAALARSDFGADTLAEVASGGRRLSFDAHGLVRAERTGPLEMDAAYDPALLDHLTALKLADDEAAHVLGGARRESLGELPIPEVLLTHGAHGSVIHADGEERRIEARPVAADPTGAGDAFAAAYAVGRVRGLPPYPAAVAASRLVEALLARGA